MYMLLYVDDILIMRPNLMHINYVKIDLNQEFEMNDSEEVFKILGHEYYKEKKENINCFR